MKYLFIVIASFCISSTFAQAKKSVNKKTVSHVANLPVTKLSSIDSLSYSIGVQVAEFYKNQGIDKINTAMIKKAYDDVYANKSLIIQPEQCNSIIQVKMQEGISAKSTAEKEKSARFLAENKKRPGVITLPSGLQYEVITKGTGIIPTAKDTVKANYAGTLIDGFEFDNSYKRGEPLEIPVTRVIPGWTEALELMPVGSKWKIYIPSNLGYGDRGAGQIPGGAALIFTLELLDIVHH
ncbi:MAG: FKBP-type peptidyl-prolyl cis-trans isomerase [Bacteroidetes bacterium]|nr:FKBP-type peptidyl-prolyl cis-trans isomerase [Bacteroidota bacterium]